MKTKATYVGGYLKVRVEGVVFSRNVPVEVSAELAAKLKKPDFQVDAPKSPEVAATPAK